ncbi:helix-turn-helix transcriptional regulator [Hyphomonas sp.]|uniref:helix-turn-helix domain-containing protein n=1 Tax=Hyphomonas sp. TaxID=87 RepID=UPI0025C2E7DE|nr:helix-turn-helix transcriptional regulator [Hyphomonas sp.]
MTNSQAESFVSKVLAETPISEGNKIYFQERLKSRLHEILVNTFQMAEQRGAITKTELARKLGKRPEQISRWLNSSSNMQLNTLSDMLLGLGYEPDISVRELSDQPAQTASSTFPGIENNETFAAVSWLIFHQAQPNKTNRPTAASTCSNWSNTYRENERINA